MNDGSSEARRQQARLYTLVAVGVVVLLLATSLFSPVVIKLFTAQNYHEAGRVVLVLVLAWLFQGLYSLVLQPLFYFGGGIGMSIPTVTALIAAVALSLLLIPPFGMYGAAWAMVVCFAVKFLVGAVVSTILYPLPWELRKIVLAVGVGASLAAIGMALPEDLPVVVALTVKSATLLAIIPLLWCTGIVTTRELVRMRNVAAKVINSFISK